MEVCYSVIGTVHTDFRDPEAIPLQGVYSGVEGTVEILPEFRKGLMDLEGFSHIFLVYHFHEAGPPQLSVRPFLDTVERGIFSTRHPDKPNAIGLSIVELVSVKDLTLSVRGVDILDGPHCSTSSPTLDSSMSLSLSAVDGWKKQPGEAPELKSILWQAWIRGPESTREGKKSGISSRAGQVNPGRSPGIGLEVNNGRDVPSHGLFDSPLQLARSFNTHP